MNDRRYYSIRTGREPRSLDLVMLLQLFGILYSDFTQKGLFCEAFGYNCVDDGPVPGKLGGDIDGVIQLRLRKAALWPVEPLLSSYKEDDLFDMVEFLHDIVSKPKRRSWHQFCGWHYSDFNSTAGRQAFRTEVNQLLRDYRDGYELSDDGEILALGDEHMRPLLEQELPEYDPENVGSRVEAAVLKFRHHTPTLEDKQEAVRQLADVLEFLHKKLEGLLPSKEENELFMIANKFGIRHHRADQKTEYDKEIWLDWILYCYLNTIHVSVNLLKRAEESSQ